MDGLQVVGSTGGAGPEDALAVEDAVLVEGQGAGFKAMHGRGDQFLGGFDVDVAEEGQRQVQGLGAHDSAAGGGRACSAQLTRSWPGWGRARGRRRGAWWTYGGDCMPRFGVLVLVVCVGGVLAAGAVGFFSRRVEGAGGPDCSGRSRHPVAPAGGCLRFPRAHRRPAHSRPRHARLAGRSADTLLGRRGAWRVFEGFFRWKILPGRVNMARGRPYLRIGVSHYETRLFCWRCPGSKGSFVVLGRFFLNGLAQDADVLAKALYSPSSAPRFLHQREAPLAFGSSALLPTSRAIVSMPSRARSS